MSEQHIRRAASPSTVRAEGGFVQADLSRRGLIAASLAGGVAATFGAGAISAAETISQGAMTMSEQHAEAASPSLVDVIKRFYAAEAAYMAAGGAAGGASFAGVTEVLDPEVVLHQTPDLPWGGDYHGHAGYEAWARKMSEAFDQLAVKDTQMLTAGDTLVILCRLVTRSRRSGQTLDLPMAQVVRVKGGRIIEFRPFYWNVPAYRSAV